MVYDTGIDEASESEEESEEEKQNEEEGKEEEEEEEGKKTPVQMEKKKKKGMDVVGYELDLVDVQPLMRFWTRLPPPVCDRQQWRVRELRRQRHRGRDGLRSVHGEFCVI